MIKPREKTPELQVKLVNNTSWKLSAQSAENFIMIVFYRGLHCPVCKSYLEDLQSKLPKFKEAGVTVVAISTDTESRARETYEKWNIKDLPIGFELPIEEARKWGLFISKGIKDSEPERFSEPALFLIKPDGTVYYEAIQSMPFARPPFNDMLGGIHFAIKADYPARGED